MNRITLPTSAQLEAAAAALTAVADVKRQITLSKGLYDLLLGAEIVAVVGGFLLPSASRPGLIHRFDNATGGCTCEAGAHGRFCRHAAAIEIVETAQATMPRLVSADRAAKIAAAERAAAELNELFA